MPNSDHCLRCKTRTPNRGEGISSTSNGRLRRHSKCSGCGAGKSRFLPGRRGSGNLSAGVGQKGGSFFGDLGDNFNSLLSHAGHSAIDRYIH